jgi:hypothetical protein
VPMIQVNRVVGHAFSSARSAAAAWQASPMADKRSMQTLCGGVSNLGGSSVGILF